VESFERFCWPVGYIYVFSSTQDTLFENIVITKYKIQDFHGLRQILFFHFRSEKKLLCSNI